ncbi:2-hydroxyacid dehydrogenase [Eilatimonas milleporae]|uniref:Glyoxylate/hydroxypyruvate reductase A n=1 Tax=Eilatimonas milleporae TaxID=911205 RepID=A0A3M0CR12_9PROT|nr:glyoxylate/hydroxypyruvate reductase A [Eilatimonas milleporae]RMB12001.1 glyoxylate/hydroxypyruvate reductase A [Eilatimonas milleporae]
MTRILFYLRDYPDTPWRDALCAEDPGIRFHAYPDWGTADDGPAYALVWEPEPGLIARFPNIRAVFSMGAGVDHLTRDDSLPADLPIIRMGDSGLQEGMREYVTWAVLHHHRQMPQFAAQQRTRKWARLFSRPAASVQVGIMGYGHLGRTVADALAPFGYRLAAWSRTPKDTPGVTHYTGLEDLPSFLSTTDILVALLPETAATHHLLNAERLSLLPTGASVVNAGRGGLIDLDALTAALAGGRLAGATLDVTDPEPLPADHPAWDCPNLTITPHVAAITRPDTAARFITEQIARLERGEPAETGLDRSRGY